MHRFLIRIYELVRRYGFYIGVLPSLIELFFYQHPAPAFCGLAHQPELLLWQDSGGACGKAPGDCKGNRVWHLHDHCVACGVPFGGIPFASGDFRAVKPDSPVDIPRNFLRKECSSQTGSL